MKSLTRRFWAVGVITAALMAIAGVCSTGFGVRPVMAQTCQQAIRNPEFEQGAAAWETRSLTGSDIIVSEAAFHGQYGARLGGTNEAADSLWQSVVFPDAASNVSLTFFYRIETSDASRPPADQLSVDLGDDVGRTLVHLTTLHNQGVRGQWLRRVLFLDLDQVATVAGRTVQLRFRATTDGSAPTQFLIDDINFQVCTGGPPELSDLQIRSAPAGTSTDHFTEAVPEIFISFDYANISKDDEIRLLIRDEQGVILLDHTYTRFIASGTEHVVFTARDAVDGLVRTGLDAGNSVARDAESALQAESRFRMIPYVERAFVATEILQDATTALRKFHIGEAADDDLSRAQDHIDVAVEAAQAIFDPSTDLDASRRLVETMRREAQLAVEAIAEARSVFRGDSLVFPDTTGCRFYLTNIYLNKAPVDSIEWTVGTPGPPVHIYPPLDMRREGSLRVRPLTIYTQAVDVDDAPHVTTVAGRVTDADCRPVTDGTQVALSLSDPALGSLSSPSVGTAGGHFTTALRSTENLGSGTVVVRARAGTAAAEALVFIVGPPASVSVATSGAVVTPGQTATVLVRVRDAQGQAVADGTGISFGVSPVEAGSVMPKRTTTSGGVATGTFEAGHTPMFVVIHATAGGVDGSVVMTIAEPTPTTAPTPTSVPTSTPTPAPGPSPTVPPACSPNDPEQLCDGAVSVRVFEDPRCDGQFNDGIDQPIFGVPVGLIFPDGSSIYKRTDPNGYAPFRGIYLRGGEQTAVLVEYSEELVSSGLTPCENSGTLKFLDRDDFGAFRTVSVAFRAHRQIVSRRGILRVAEASLCFSASYYLEPFDGGPVAYLATEQDLSDFLGREVWITGSTWQIEFCQYLLPVSIELVP